MVALDEASVRYRKTTGAEDFRDQLFGVGWIHPATVLEAVEQYRRALPINHASPRRLGSQERHSPKGEAIRLQRIEEQPTPIRTHCTDFAHLCVCTGGSWTTKKAGMFSFRHSFSFNKCPFSLGL